MLRLRSSSHTSIPPPLAVEAIWLDGKLIVAPLCFRQSEVRATEYAPPHPARTSGAARSKPHLRTCTFRRLAPSNRPHVAREENGERRAEAERGRAEDRLARPCSLRHRPGDREPERGQDERTERVVGRDARQLLLRDLLLERRVPEDREDLDADPGERGGRDDDGERSGDREREQERNREEKAERRREERPLEAEAQEDEPAGEEAERPRGEDEPPAGRAAEVGLRDRRAGHPPPAPLPRALPGETGHDPPPP